MKYAIDTTIFAIALLSGCGKKQDSNVYTVTFLVEEGVSPTAAEAPAAGATSAAVSAPAM